MSQARKCNSEFDDRLEVESDDGHLHLPLALQLQFLPEMSFSGFGLMGSTPERPSDDVRRFNASLGEPYSDAPDFLD